MQVNQIAPDPQAVEGDSFFMEDLSSSDEELKQEEIYRSVRSIPKEEVNFHSANTNTPKVNGNGAQFTIERMLPTPQQQDQDMLSPFRSGLQSPANGSMVIRLNSKNQEEQKTVFHQKVNSFRISGTDNAKPPSLFMPQPVHIRSSTSGINLNNGQIFDHQDNQQETKRKEMISKGHISEEINNIGKRGSKNPKQDSQYVKTQQNNLFATMPPKYQVSKNQGTQGNSVVDQSKSRQQEAKKESFSMLQRQQSRGNDDFSSIIMDPNNSKIVPNLKFLRKDQSQNPYSILLNTFDDVASNIFSDNDGLSFIKALNESPNRSMNKSQKINASLVKQSPQFQQKPSRNIKILGNFPSDLELRIEKIQSPKNAANRDFEGFATMTPEQIGQLVKSRIEGAPQGSLIQLPDCHIKISDLTIEKPMTIKGCPGTILEITHGSITVDFGEAHRYKDVLIICECHIIFSDRADLIMIQDELEREDQHHDTQYLTTQKSNKVGLINSQPSEFTHQRMQSGDSYNYDNPQREVNKGVTTHGLMSHSDLRHSIYPLFRIKNYTYVEIRDCWMLSKNKLQVMDVAFAMNENEITHATNSPQSRPNNAYKGILSVKSCIIENFSLSFYAGTNSILSVEVSQIKDCRLGGIYVINPKILKVSSTILDNIEGVGLIIKFKNSDQTQSIPHQLTSLSNFQSGNFGSSQSFKEQTRKIYLEDNKFMNCTDTGLTLEGEKNLLSMKVQAKVVKCRFYHNKKNAVYLKRLINGLDLEFAQCDFYNTQVSHLLAKKVKIDNQDQQITFTKCKFVESSEEGTLLKDSNGLFFNDCDFVRNKHNGLVIEDTGASKHLRVKQTLHKTTSMNHQLSIPQLTINHEKVFEVNPAVSEIDGQLNDTFRDMIKVKHEPIHVQPNQVTPTGLSTLMSIKKIDKQQPRVLTKLERINEMNENEEQITQKIVVGLIKISKCRFSENKMNGLVVKNLYQKTLEIHGCKAYDNQLSGFSINQDLESEEELRSWFNNYSQLNSARTNSQQNFTQTQPSYFQRPVTQQQYQSSRHLIIRKDIIQHAKMILVNCEITSNKQHGIEMGYTRTRLSGCAIADNGSGYAIRLQQMNAKLLLRLIDNLKDQTPGNMTTRSSLICGRIGGPWGEIQPPYKQIQGKIVNGNSDLTRILNDLNVKEDKLFDNQKQPSTTEKIEILKLKDNKSRNHSLNKKKPLLSCMQKTEKKVDIIGDYLVIKESSNGKVKSEYLTTRPESQQRKTCVRGCFSPSAANRDTNCLIF